MNQDIKAEWVEALRSGSYQQGEGVLRREDNAYCCLGVLCDVLGVQWQDRGYYWTARGCEVDLPDDIREEARIRRREEWRLQQLNDTERKTFEEIANYIEAEL